MKKIKSLIVLLLILVFAMSMMAACRPADEDGDWDNGGNDGNTIVGGGNQPEADDPSSEGDTPSDDENDGPSTENPAGNEGENKTDKDNGNENKDPDAETVIGESGQTIVIENPLMSESKAYNQDATPSYNIDDIKFSKATLSELKGKTLTYYTSVDYNLFSYDNKSNKSIGEWAWLKELKKAYGLTVKYVRCSPGNNVIKPFQAMSAGKDCDVVATHVASFPYICNILAPLEPYYDFSKMEDNPGVNPMVTELTRWKGHNIVVGPNGDLGAWNYNSTYVKNAGLEDPYDLWKKGEWTWTNFKKYMVGLPDTTSKGQKVYGAVTAGQYYYWPCTNNKPCFEIDGDDPNGGIINNWTAPEVKETFIWLEGVCDAGGSYLSGDAGSSFWGTDKAKYCVMVYGTPGVNVVGIEEEENKANDYRWCPFPRNEKNPDAISHVEMYGRGFGLPRKTNKEGNRAAAAKFIDLICNRWTEARFDNLRHKSKWSTEKIMEYFNYGETHARFGLGSGVGQFHSLAVKEKFIASIADASFSAATCMEKCNNHAKNEVANVLKFGVQ